MSDSLIKICIDAGHGGNKTGATRKYDGIEILEKDLNLEIALQLEVELKNYQNVEIIQTRRNDLDLDLEKRVEIAKESNCDFLISLHNATSEAYQSSQTGCMILPPGSQYQPENCKIPSIYDACDHLSKLLINHLNKIGIPTSFKSGNGLYRRKHSPEDGASKTIFYPNGEIADYYSIVRNGVEMGIPSIIIEHAYLNNESDYRTFLSNKEKLRQLAVADSDAIAEYFSLKLKEK